ncbi:MAG: hypothetical protein ACYSWR_04685, partial [Planctomycetota bacterium]
MFETSSRNYEDSVAVANNPQRSEASEGQGQQNAKRRPAASKHSSENRQESTLEKIRNFSVEFG